MYRGFALLAALLILVAPSAAGPASADDRSVDFSVTLVTTNYTPGQLFSDGLGNQYFQGSTFTGQASGWPFNGTFRLDANISIPAGASSGDLDGAFVLSDSSGSTIHGDIENGRIGNLGTGQTAVDARVRFDGGTGFLDGASGRARLTGTVPLGSQPMTLSAPFGQPQVLYSPTGGQVPVLFSPNGQPQFAQLSGVTGPTMNLSGTITVNDLSQFPGQSSFSNPFGNAFGQSDDNVRPGNGFGDQNHDHSGPPGQNNQNHNNNNNRGHGRGHHGDD